MKTDNSNIVVESLQQLSGNCYGKYFPYDKMYIDDGCIDWDYLQEAIDKTCSDAANWQKEQLLPLIESHKQLYEALLEASNIFDNYPETHELKGTYEVVWNALNKAINLL